MRMSNSAATAQHSRIHPTTFHVASREQRTRAESQQVRARRCSLSAWLRLDENDLVAAEEELSGIIHLPELLDWNSSVSSRNSRIARALLHQINRSHEDPGSTHPVCPKNVYLSEESIHPSPTAASSAQHPTTHPQKTTSKMSTRLTCSRESSL